MQGDKKSATLLIFTFFRISGETTAEFKCQLNKLTDEDKLQLASAIARVENIPADQLQFTPVAY